MIEISKKKRHSRILALFLIYSFVLFITTETMPFQVHSDSDEEFNPVVRVKEGKQEVTPAQKGDFEKLINEGKRLLQEEMDYEGALRKFKQAKDIATTGGQKADALFYISLAHYGTLQEKGTEELFKTIRQLSSKVC
jgi:hypothetical protein